MILKPDYPHARFNRAMQLLREGRYEDGWVEYEWRWASGQLTWPEIPRPKWDGGPLNGRSLLVHTEQGVGDVLMFLRFLPRIKQRARRSARLRLPESDAAAVAKHPVGR